ncbi:hypothetical protein ACQ4PT_018387 [Festuca glaucescens]
MRSLTAVSQADTSTRTVRALAAMSPGGRESRGVAGGRDMIPKKASQVVYATGSPKHNVQKAFSGSIAEGNFNFTSTSTTSREDLTQVISDDDEPKGYTEADIAERESEDEHEVMDPAPSAQSMAQVEHQEVKGKMVAAARNKLAKIPKRSPKKRNSNGIVQVMERMVQVREKEVTQEQPLQKFSITRCMDALKTLDGMTGSIKIPALDVFKIADNREIFINLVDDKDGTAMVWLLAQIAKLA